MKIDKNSKTYSNDYDKYLEVNESLQKEEPGYLEVAKVIIIGKAPAKRAQAAEAIKTKDTKTLEGITLGDVATPSELKLLKDKNKNKP